MEVSVSVVSKEQAQQICRNWRKNVNRYYRTILTSLAAEEPEDAKAAETTKEEIPQNAAQSPAKNSAP